MIQVPHTFTTRTVVAVIIYFTFLLDNILLTVIVPILPDYLMQISDQFQANSLPDSVVYKNFSFHYLPEVLAQDLQPTAGGQKLVHNSTVVEKYSNVENENAAIGLLLAIKAIVQIFCNPLIGNATKYIGYSAPIMCGTMCILLATLVFCVGNSYGMLLLARMIHGVGSACVNVCGMSLIAQLYSEEDKRSKVMGVILGSVALGVLIGYPLGGIFYDFIGISAPFMVIALFLIITLIAQFKVFEFNFKNESCLEKNSQNWRQLLTDHLIIIVVAGIWVSTSAMSILEPCLPVWLISNLHPKKWQLGTVFIPDSIGYLIGTNCFGDITYKYGQLKFTAFATMLVGVSCIMIPNATTVIKLLPPHFTLGLGIGIVDAALVPLLATFMDTNDKSNESDAFASHAGSHYGLVYAIQQTAVSLAYSLAPIIGGELAQTIGFPWLMGIVGTINLFYSLTLLLTMKTLQKKFYKSENMIILKEITTTTDATNRYTRFYNSVD